MKKTIIILVIGLLFCPFSHASSKVYLIHGLAGTGIEMKKAQKAIEKEGWETEIFTYPSLEESIDSVAFELFDKIQKEGRDTISFVTHSMGALVVRCMYERLDTVRVFPFIHRIVMIAPPNNGSPVADFFVQFSFIKNIVGPNINNLITDSLTGAGKYPVPTCEVGLIAGSYGSENGFNPFVKGDNDGLLLTEQTKLGIEKDCVFVRSSHMRLLFNKKVVKYIIDFLRDGEFSSNF